MSRLATSVFLVALAHAAFAVPQPAASAERFIDSIGVCTHWGYPDTPYGFAFEEVKRRLVESGIRHVRDGWHERLIELGKAGIQATLVSDVEKTPAEWVELIKKGNAAGARIVAIEGPNEPDLFWKNYKKSYRGKGHEQGERGIIEGVIAFQKDLYAALKADPATGKITVIGPSLGKTYGYDVKSPFGAGTLTDAVDWGNFHPYPGGNPFSPPFRYGGLEKYLWHGGQPSSNIDEFPYSFDIYAPPFAPKPMSATETGYSTFASGPTETAHAKYLPRLFAEYFRKGIQRTHSYEFVDEFNKPDEREANFGLLRYDRTPKPAYHALSGLIALLTATPTPNFTPQPLDYELSVAKAGRYDRTQYVRHLLLQKSSGEYALLLWHEIALDETDKKPWRRLPLAPPMPVQIKFASPVRSALLLDPSEPARPVTEWKDIAEISLGVPDRVVVMRIANGKP